MGRQVEYILNLHIYTSCAAAGVITLIRNRTKSYRRETGFSGYGLAKESLWITGSIACVS